MEERIIAKNKQYWDDHADLWFGATSLPQYGVRFITEDELHFFSDANRKISTYVNALYDAGFIIEKMVEQTDEQTLSDTENNTPKAQKARMVPLSMCFKCRKL